MQAQITNASLVRSGFFIDGHEHSTTQQAKTFAVFNPATQSPIGELPDCGAQETEQAIEAAARASQTWSATPAKQRAAILFDWYALILENKEDLARIIVCEQGKPLAEARGEVVYAANFVQWFAEQAKRIHGGVMADYAPQTQLQFTKEAVGVVGVITPWNFPIAMITRKMAPALAAGCSVVCKPSELTPYSALALSHLAHQAGVPAGVYNTLTSSQASVVGACFSRSTAVRKISFTGSTKVGALLIEQSAATVKRMSLELGGNAPFIVFDDADIDRAVDALMLAKFRNAGQTCVCANRIYVHSAISDQFLAQFTAKTQALQVGDGLAEGTQIGPLINAKAVEKAERHVEAALSDGAELLCGGRRHPLGGTFFTPTILSGVKPVGIFSCEESFAPIAPISSFDDEDEVIAWANASDYGLAAYFFTQDFRRIDRVNKALESGMVGVNEGMISNEFGPFGGVKFSGLGREGSIYGIDEYLEIKYSLVSFR